MNADTRQAPTDVQAPSVTRLTTATAGEVWAVLADGWTYPCWIVGTARMRAVEPGFPSAGTRLHHSFGAWPLTIDDETISLSAEPESRLVLEAHGWPLGEARVEIGLTPIPGGTEISIAEDATKGPGRWLVPGPARQALITARNTETLRRLVLLAEHSPGVLARPVKRRAST